MNHKTLADYFTGWNFKRIVDVNMDFVKQKALEYGCDSSPLDLRSIPCSKHLLNVRKSDQRCFLYSVASYFLENEIEDLTDGSDPIYAAWMSTLRYQINVHARLLILRKKSTLHGLI